MTSNIVLAITGGIAAYKAAFLARLLVKAKHNVRVIMTEGGQQFITPLSLQALTGNPVHDTLLDSAAEAGMGHIELAKWADVLIIAPASANTLARLAGGMADDLLSSVCLATAAPVLLAPAMNQHMWAHPALQHNLSCLRAYGYHVIEPAAGVQACGDVGSGRLPEPEWLYEQVLWQLAKRTQPQSLAGKQVVITAGPTIEAIDPVRYLSNHSSGKMGFALAQACRNAGAHVTLIVGGKVALPVPVGVTCMDVLSANDMLQAARVCTQQRHTDVFIATAAVADYRTRDKAPQKIKKTQEAMTLDLVKNPDILASISAECPHLFTLGFAAETQDVAHYAQGKLTSKGLDMIACNDVSRQDIGFASNDNAMTVFFAKRYHKAPLALAKASKTQIAQSLVTLMAEAIHSKHTVEGPDPTQSTPVPPDS